MRLAPALSVGLLALLAAPAAAAPARAGRVPSETVAGGQHWRLRTAHGEVHVWRPAGYRRDRAGLVVYVHGHNLRVDQAWEVFRLAEQFRASRQNALFIVPEAPQSSAERVHWPSLAELAREAARQTHQPLPGGHWVAAGHSGGFRTLAAWLDHPRLDHLILLDGLYANEPQFKAWLEDGPRAGQHRMFLVGADTRARCETFVKSLAFARRRKSIPLEAAELTRRERGARVLFLVSQYNHNQMMQNGKVLPLLLRLTRLRALR